MNKKHLIAGVALVIIDQLSKYGIQSSFYPGETLGIASFFQITYARNTGIAFSMFQGGNRFFIFFTLALIVAFYFWYRQNKSALTKGMPEALVLVASGAVGNLIDRIAHGYVIDFLDFSIGSYHWPSFNVADSCITVGAAILFLSALRSPKPSAPQADIAHK